MAEHYERMGLVYGPTGASWHRSHCQNPFVQQLSPTRYRVQFAARDDKTYDIRLGPTYLANRYVHVSLEYRYLQRESDDNTALLLHKEFNKNLLILQLNTQL